MITHKICPLCGCMFATGYDALLDRTISSHTITVKTVQDGEIGFDIHKNICHECWKDLLNKFNGKGEPK